MRFRRLMAASMAGVMAVSTAIVCQISASAADPTYDNSKPFIEIDGRTQYYGLSTWRVAQNVAEGTDTYHFETTTTSDYDDDFTEGNLTVYFYDLAAGALSDLEIVSFKVNGVEKRANITGAVKDGSTWDNIAGANAAAGSRKSIVVADADNNVTIPAAATVSLDVKVTYTPVTVGTSGEWEQNTSTKKWQIANTGAGASLNKQLTLTLSDYTDLEPGKIGSIKVDLLCSGDFANGSIGINDSDSKWQQTDWASDGTISPEIVLPKGASGDLLIQANWFNQNTTIIVDKVTITPIKVAVDSITLDKETASIQKGSTVTLTPTVLPADATDPTVTWESSDEEIATVADGVVTGVAAGTATITAKAGEKTATCEVTVTPTDAETIAAAKTAAETAITNFAATNQTTLADIENAVKQAIKDAKITAEIIVTAKCDIVTASETAPGSIKGTVTLKLNDATATVDNVNLTIKQLPADDAARVADAKEATEKVLKGITATKDIKDADVLAKIKAAIADTKAEAAITDFKVTPSTSAEAGSVTGTVTLTSGNESATVAINLPIEKLPEEKPVDPVEPDEPAASEALWEGSTELVSDWTTSVQITGKDFTDFGAGTVVVELEPGEGAQLALKIGTGNWAVLPGLKDWYDVTGNTFEFEVTAEAMKALGKNPLIVGGKNATVKKVTFVPAKADTPAADETVEIDATSTPVSKIESVATKTDASGNVTEQIAYCAISEADAKKYDSYIVTITRGKDTKKFTQEIKDCFKAVQYEDKDGETVQVNAKDGSYCILLDITGIGSDFGGITVSIAPNA